jgi:hypothetical protein
MHRRIGIALSGGGSRAAAWGLGVLLYITDAGLNGRVVTSSSVSGGSITNAAVALQPYGDMRPREFWELSARLARRVAGDVKPFLVLLGLHVAGWVVAIVGAATHRPVLVAVALGATVLMSVLVAPICRDATFASRLVWLYFDVLAASLALLAFLAGDGWWWLPALVLVGVVLLFRGVVVGWAIGNSLLRMKGGRSHLADLSSEIDHVLCACDLHGRHHVYFGRDFVYSFAHRLGSRPTLALDAALQSSANLPGAFPPRPMWARPFRFTGSRSPSPVLALTDGGVYDNMAEEWLLSFAKRTARFRERADEVATTDPELGGVLRGAAERLAAREPDFVVIANASGSLGPRFAWTTFLPLVGELFALLRVKSILYDNGNTTRRRLIVDEFIDGDLSGIIVHIDTDPWDVVGDGRASTDPTVRGRAEAVAVRLTSTPGLEPASTIEPAGAATVLYPLGRGRIAKLLQRSYALACVQAHIWHDLPLVEIPPLPWFEALEAGRVEARSMPRDVTTVEARDALALAPPGGSVPVSLDAIRDLDGTQMARVTYFVIASNVPEPSWLLELGERHGASVMALGLLGVVCGPGPRTTLFRLPEQIDELFREIGAKPSLSIELEDLWIPAGWLGATEPQRGEVFRLERSLFQAAYRFRTQETSKDEFVERTSWEGAVLFSPEETQAFRRWAEGRIGEAIEVYPKDEALALSYREVG